MNKLCGIGLCLLVASEAVSIGGMPEERKPLSEEESASLKEDLKRPENLKKFLLDRFDAGGHNGGEVLHIIRFGKQGLGLQDEIARPVLLDICREAAQKTGWKIMVEWESEKRLYDSLCWLGVFADGPVKKFLLGIATDNAKDAFYRAAATRGYFYCAEAGEVRDFFVHMVNKKRDFPVELRETVIDLTRRLFFVLDEVLEEDTPKREAILASLYVVVAQESDERLFRHLDGILQWDSKEYATSYQRADLWKRKFKDTRRVSSPTTNVSISLKELKRRDFSKPPENTAEAKPATIPYLWPALTAILALGLCAALLLRKLTRRT